MGLFDRWKKNNTTENTSDVSENELALGEAESGLENTEKESVTDSTVTAGVVDKDIKTDTVDEILQSSADNIEETTVTDEANNEETKKASEDMAESSLDNEEVTNDEKEEASGGFFTRLKKGLVKTRNSIAASLDNIFTASEIDDDFYDEIEEILIMSDIGVVTTKKIIDELKDKVKEQHIKHPADCKQLLIESMKNQMSNDDSAYDFEETKSVVLVIGVNGVGKTTTIGKLASKYKNSGKKVLLAAADTFRAAAGEQLVEWANRAGVDIIKGVEGQDPASVVYDALQSAKAKNTDILICDTAGRLHNKKNLMEELKKIHRIIDKEYPGAMRETLVVLDGTTGQNALSQAKEFHEAADATGIVLTKLDGTAKGGIAIAVQSELGIPVKYIGVGESIEDLQKFNSESFIDAIFA